MSLTPSQPPGQTRRVSKNNPCVFWNSSFFSLWNWLTAYSLSSKNPRPTKFVLKTNTTWGWGRLAGETGWVVDNAATFNFAFIKMKTNKCGCFWETQQRLLCITAKSLLVVRCHPKNSDHYDIKMDVSDEFIAGW